MALQNYSGGVARSNVEADGGTTHADAAAIAGFASDPASLAKAAVALAKEFASYWPTAKLAAQGPIDVVDMFAGCGGMSAGFMAVNALLPAYRLALAIDIDRLAMDTYAANLGLQPLDVDLDRFSDDQSEIVETVNRARSSRSAPLVMIGCAPCQGFSSHRNSAGASDARNSLFVTFARIAAKVQPDAVIMENVPEILTDGYWPTVEAARRALEEAGYFTVLSAHDMAEFGVPQNRYRAVLVAMKRPFVLPHGFLERREFRTVRQAIGTLPHIEPGEVCPSDAMHFTAKHRSSTVDTIKAVPADGGARPSNVGPECLRRVEVKQGRAAYEDVYGRLWWDRPAITITGHARNPASGRYVHPEQHRGLSVREAALLQGFPPGWAFRGGLGPAFMQVGNAVPPPFAAFLAVHLLGELFGPKRLAASVDVGIRASIGPSFSRIIPALKAGHRSLSTMSRHAHA